MLCWHPLPCRASLSPSPSLSLLVLCAFCTEAQGSVSAAPKWLRRPRFLFQSKSGISGKEAAFSLDGCRIFSIATLQMQ